MIDPARKIPYTKPSITELEIEYAADAARNGWEKIAMNIFTDLRLLLRSI